VFTSTLLARLMDRYPIIVYLGAAVLGKVTAEMVFTDPAVTQIIGELSHTTLYVLEAIFAGLVIVVAKLWLWFFRSEPTEVEPVPGVNPPAQG